MIKRNIIFVAVFLSLIALSITVSYLANSQPVGPRGICSAKCQERGQDGVLVYKGPAAPGRDYYKDLNSECQCKNRMIYVPYDNPDLKLRKE